jgi:hypothetical protein
MALDGGTQRVGNAVNVNEPVVFSVMALLLINGLATHAGVEVGKRGGAAANTVRGVSESECARCSLGETVTLRGHDHPTRLASPELSE